MTMRTGRAITVVGCHAGGEIGNVVVGGVLPPPGATVFEQMQALRADDSLRRLLLREPRGSVAVHANLIAPEARDLSLVGERIRLAAREQLPCVHPENPDIAGVSIVQIAESWQGIGAVSKNAVVVAPGRLDRSATGTGLSARMAALHARGAMRAGDAMTHASVLGTTFDGRIVSETTVGGRPAIVPAIRGSAWITGITQVIVDPTDPFPEGYLLSDTWPGPDSQQ